MPIPYTDDVGPETPVKLSWPDAPAVGEFELAMFFEDDDAACLNAYDQRRLILTIGRGETFRGGRDGAHEWSLEMAR